MLTPVMPDTCARVFDQIGARLELTAFDSALSFGALPSAAAVVKGGVLFPRLDVNKELEELSAGN